MKKYVLPFHPLIRLFVCCQKAICYFLINLGVSRRFQSAISTVVDEEFEYEVQNSQILQENFQQSISNFQRKHV